jgi:hypothetical protein
LYGTKKLGVFRLVLIQDFMATRFLRYSMIAGFLSLVILVLIPSDPKNARLLGFSTARLAMVAGFLLILGLLQAAIWWLKRRPAREQQLNRFIQDIPRRRRLCQWILFLATLVILTGLYQLAEFVMTSDAFLKSYLLRLLPVAFFAAVVSWGVLRLDALRESGRPWIAVLGLTVVGTVAGRLFQAFLQGLVERPTPVNSGTIMASQVGLALVVFLWAAHFIARPRKERPTWALLLLLVALLAYIQWWAYPNKYWRAMSLVALFTPLAVYAIALLAQLVFSLWDRLRLAQQARWRTILPIGAILVLLALAIPYYTVAVIHSRTLNYAPIFTDQGEYLKFAETARLRNFNYTGDQNRMPLYPFLQGLFYQPGMGDQAFFDQGKLRNIFLSLALQALMYLIFRRYLGSWIGPLLTGIIAFSLYIFKAPYFQSEILYYFLAFLGFLLALEMLAHPSLKLGIATGIIFGLAHLTKASVLPGLVLFGVLFALKYLIQLLRKLKGGALSLENLAPLGRQLLAGVLVFVFFILVIFPYINAMKQRFGHYFYNVNTTFYVWFDTNPQAFQAEAKYHFAEQWPSQLPPDQIPSLRNYLRQHTLAQIEQRFFTGLSEQIDNVLSPFSVTNYQLSYLVILCLVFLADLRNSLRLVGSHPYRVAFSLLYFLGYLAAFAWYSPIAPERRFLYGLYIPFMFALFCALETMTLPRENSQDHPRRIDLRLFLNAAHFVIFLSLVANVWLVLTERMFFDRFGA